MSTIGKHLLEKHSIKARSKPFETNGMQNFYEAEAAEGYRCFLITPCISN